MVLFLFLYLSLPHTFRRCEAAYVSTTTEANQSAPPTCPSLRPPLSRGAAGCPRLLPSQAPLGREAWGTLHLWCPWHGQDGLPHAHPRAQGGECNGGTEEVWPTSWARPNILAWAGALWVAKVWRHDGFVSQDLLSSARVVVINCMSIKSPRAIFSRLSSELLPPKAARRKDMEEALVKHITSFKKMM